MVFVIGILTFKRANKIPFHTLQYMTWIDTFEYKSLHGIISVFPFSNFYSTVHFTGFAIKKYLEHTIDAAATPL